MTSSVEEAILILKRSRSNSSRLRMVFGNDHVRMTLQGRVESVEDSKTVWCVGPTVGDEIRFDLASASSIAFIDERGVPAEFQQFAHIVDELIAITWRDGSRLTLLNEK